MDVSAVRKRFPALQHHEQIFMDNAGGTQTLGTVIDSVVNYIKLNNAQIGATYPVARSSIKLIEDGWQAAAKYINADRSEVVFGASTTQLLRNLSSSLHDHVQPGDEIIVSVLDHEANIAPWVQLAQDRGATLKWYKPKSKTNPLIESEALSEMMSSRTKIVACTHVSNVLGSVNDIKSIAEVVHKTPGALLCADGVAYAPHKLVDVKELGVDFYSFSWYKLFGPHVATLYASKTAQKYMRNIGQPYRATDSLEGLLSLAAASYELVASIPDVCQFMSEIPWDLVSECEKKLQGILIDYLNSVPDKVQIWGQPVADTQKRIPVVSFTVHGRRSQDVVEVIQGKSNIGFKWGSFLSVKLCEDVLGLTEEDGVIRLSLAHYNTDDEVHMFVRLLDEVIKS
ncbi:unnamed protein product [Clonostachys rosea]|uniref:Aminotransferase class V domain-containing protein n=1 Tax=Bionectria ochroleuca TaxID=29856 RepID=A0ABY6U8C9_BIOOC|nr:unnamed protein product [Clonostachys rosea]